MDISIDLEAEGRQSGFITLIHSDDRYSFSAIPVPIFSIRNGEGPTVLLTAGVHGDEYEGIAILRRFLAEITPRDVSGRIIVMPTTNYPAFLAVSRVSPLDGMNFNRIFPGAPDGSPSEQLASIIDTQLLPIADYVLDFHSGSSSCDYIPCTFLYGIKNRHMAGKIAVAETFGTAFSMVIDGNGSVGSLLSSCERHDVLGLSTELGGDGHLKTDTYKVGVAGLYRALDLWGVLKNSPVPPYDGETTFIQGSRTAAAMAPIDGMFAPDFKMGDTVEAGQVAGYIYPMDDMTREPVPVTFEDDGMVAIVGTRTIVRRGDYICKIAKTIDPSIYLP